MNNIPRTHSSKEKQVYNFVCQGFGCLQKAVVEIEIKVGKFGNHKFKLCSECAEKVK